MTNYYDVLGVPKSATEKDIRQAYRKLARRHHPDVNSGDKKAEEKFKQINEAHTVLSDPDKRRNYDKYGDNWAHADQMDEAAAQAGRGGTFRWSNFGDPDLSFRVDGGPGGIFDQLFQNLGQDLRRPAAEYPVEITLKEAYQGATRLLGLPSGRRLEVKVPPGVDNGSRVHIPAGASQQGDIYLNVSVKPHPRFQRQGPDLYTEVEVRLEEAVLGGEVTVPTLGSRVALTIPPESQNGRRFRLSGQGMPRLSQPDRRGDLYATIKVKLPTGLTTEEQDLFRQLKELRAAMRD